MFCCLCCSKIPLVPYRPVPNHPLCQSMDQTILSPPSTTNVLTQPIPTNLLPLDLLPRNRQLPPQRLERSLTQTTKRLVEILLVLLLLGSDFPHDLASIRTAASTQADLLGSKEAHVSIFVVVHVDFYASSDGARGRVVDVGAAPAAVPVVCGGVLVRDGDDGERRGRGGDGVDAVGGLGVMFGGVGTEGLVEAFPVVCVSTKLSPTMCDMARRYWGEVKRTEDPHARFPQHNSEPRSPCPSHGQSRRSFVCRCRSTCRPLTSCIH